METEGFYINSMLAAKMVSRIKPEDLKDWEKVYSQDAKLFFMDSELTLYQVLTLACIDYIKASQLSDDSQEYRDIIQGITTLSNCIFRFLNLTIAPDHVDKAIKDGYLPLDMVAQYQEDEVGKSYEPYFIKISRFHQSFELAAQIIAHWEPTTGEMEPNNLDGELNLLRSARAFIDVRENMILRLRRDQLLKGTVTNPPVTATKTPDGRLNFNL